MVREYSIMHILTCLILQIWAFFCGYTTLQDRDIEKALDGFTRAVQLDPENGEAWNNIACLYVFFPL